MGAAFGEQSLTQAISFNRDISPLLSDNCFHCHGPDASHRKADLRLDDRDAAVDFGAIVPGNASESTLVERIFTDDVESIMPPPDSHKTLTREQKDLLKRWIEEGGEYDVHWAYLPPEKSLAIAGHESSTASSAIDSLIKNKLDENGLSSSNEADKTTLLRRLYLDLLGIPPTPNVVATFVSNRDADAYESAVDELLGSKHFGERMAIPWLDVVRYADTVGFHGDQNMNVWAYRDYVIDSFNKNKPFDQFTIEQLAGDLLPNPSPEQLVATCFNRLNMMTREGGAQPNEYLAKYAADRVRTVGMTWLGSTFGCAECHDHKFDPISTKDFYSLAAFFADVKQWGVYADYGYTPNPDLRGYNNEFPFPPEIRVESDFLNRKRSRLREQIVAVAKTAAEQIEKDESLSNRLIAWKEQIQSQSIDGDDNWEVVAPNGAEPRAAAPTFLLMVDNSVEFLGDKSRDFSLSFPLRGPSVAAIRLQLLQSETHENQFLRSKKLDAVEFLPTFSIQRAKTKKTEPVRFRYATSSAYVPKYSSGSEIIGIQRGWKFNPSLATEPVTSYWLPESPIAISPGDELLVSIKQNPVGCIRVATSSTTPLDIEQPARVFQASNSSSSIAWTEAFIRSTDSMLDVRQQLNELDDQLLRCLRGVTPVLVIEATSPALVRVLKRGDWQDQSGEIVKPATPHFLPPLQSDRDQLNRLDLAKWLVSPANPLTARVFVNRVWQQFFGTGLSARPDDFGAQGEAPSHPELLDFLAVEFRESGWNVKKLVKSIVMTSTYRQSSHASPEAIAADPDNRLLSHQTPRRLEAEIVRDQVLAVAGLLNPELGGPSIKPYQPDGLYANLQFPDRPYTANDDADQYRRGVYVHWQRTFLHPMLISFGAPTREDCIAARVKANTPQQALTLLNDPSMVEASVAMADRLLRSEAVENENTDEARLRLAYQLSLSRDPKANELESMRTLISKLQEAYKAAPEDAKRISLVGLFRPSPKHDAIELAVWTNVCRVILNLHETITRY